MKKVIILIPIDYLNSRKVCEEIEGWNFISEEQVLKRLKRTLEKPKSEKIEQPLIYDLSDFVTGVNDQHLDNLNNYFITYVGIN